MTPEDNLPSSESSGKGRPVLLDTEKGLTVLLNGRYLYSRYDPKKNARAVALQTPIPPQSLVLCPSPLLGYGLDILLSRIHESSAILTVETNQLLHKMQDTSIAESARDHNRMMSLCTRSIPQILSSCERFKGFPFRRVIRIDLSGGASLDEAFYARVYGALQDHNAQWWKNHITLIKLGRLYARNIFENLSQADKSISIFSLKTDKSVMVAGAGPSLDSSIDFIRKMRGKILLIAVDTALPALLSSGITPDAVLILESQYWIEKAFISAAARKIHLIADLTARPQVVQNVRGPFSYIFTPYTDSRFLDRLSKIPPLASNAIPTIPPLGSVGLSALFIAQLLSRKEAPILFTGLDFSWGTGYTHSRGSPAPAETFLHCNRLKPVAQAHHLASAGSERVIGKDDADVFTNPAMKAFAAQCAVLSRLTKRVFYDIGSTGIATGHERINQDRAQAYIEEHDKSNHDLINIDHLAKMIDTNSITAFINLEREKIQRLKDKLMGSECEGGKGDLPLDTLISEIDCLYLHFPDSKNTIPYSQSFLNRLRIETDYFLKSIKRGAARTQT